jgi:UDP-2-acetamido-3-amino-2,3-dideoxy-glucuronate N-acetyltransferase
MIGNPARQKGWMSRHGHRLKNPNDKGVMVCPEARLRYLESPAGTLKCLDLNEEMPLPANLSAGAAKYGEVKKWAC